MGIDDYQLIDAGHFKKLERFGPWYIQRPALSACWAPEKSKWQPHASFTRLPEMKWHFKSSFPKEWKCQIADLYFYLKVTDFGHLGVFPEQLSTWQWLQKLAQSSLKPMRVLNLFAYSGGASLALAKHGVQVTHVDASKGMVTWAKDNAALNKVEGIRWIVDDVFKFLQREQKRGKFYEGIILDPPSYGKGKKGEVFKIEQDIIPLLNLVAALLSPEARFVFLSCHTPALTPLSLHHLLRQSLGHKKGTISCGELSLAHPYTPLPSGCFAKWEADS